MTSPASAARSRPALRTVTLSLASLLALGCREGAAPGNGDGTPLAADAPIEVLVEAETLAPPSSERPNRLFRGWRPVRRGRHEGAFRTAGATASLRVVTLRPEARTLVLDLADDRSTRSALTEGGHLEVRIDRGAAQPVPIADPLTIRLPPGIAPGPHLVELALPERGRRPFTVETVSLRPVLRGGRAGRDGGELALHGPAAIDLHARPGAGASVAGEVCPAGTLGTTAGLSATLVAETGEEVAGWRGGGALDRLSGCRRIELGPVADDRPVRLRLTAAPGASGRWRNLSWRGGSRTIAAPKGLPAAPAFEPPRLVVLYLFDALRADAVGRLGGGLPADRPIAGDGVSAVLDRLAAEGHAFREHRTAAPNTLLSIRQLFAGHPVIDGASWKAVGEALPHFAEGFRAAGYRTGLFSGNGYVSEAFGLARGFDHVSEDALFEPPPEWAGAGWVNRNAERVHAAALDWLDGLPSGEPVFLYLHVIHPHGPYAPPPGLEERFTAGIPSRISGANETLIGIERGRREASAADRERLRALYLASVAQADAELGRLVDALAARVPPEEAVLFVTSDHGEELFDHGGVLHGHTLYEEQLRVPLVVWAPGRAPPGETTEITDVFDLHATLADLAGAAETADGGSAGRSLLPEIDGRQQDLRGDPRLHFAASDGIAGGLFSVRWRRWKYIWARGTDRSWAVGLGPGRSWDRWYLYDLETDPDETRNLATGTGVVEGWLRTELRSWVADRLAERHLDLEAPGASDSPALDEEDRARLRALGYLD